MSDSIHSLGGKYYDIAGNELPLPPGGPILDDDLKNWSYNGRWERDYSAEKNDSSTSFYQSYNRIATLKFERFIAILIDWVVLIIGTSFIGFFELGISYFLQSLSSNKGNENLSVFCDLVIIIIFLFSFLVKTLIVLAYEGFFLSKFGATLGKKAMGLKVLHAGQNPTFLRAICRCLIKPISYLICFIGLIFPDITQDIALHDMLCDTVVVKG